MTDYTKLTEQEINEAVALIKKPASDGSAFIKLDKPYQPWNSSLDAVVIEETVNQTQSASILQNWFCYDPCNNPADWAPLLEELRQLNNVWMDNESVGLIPRPAAEMKIVKADTLGKAICILWLMVKESE